MISQYVAQCQSHGRWWYIWTDEKYDHDHDHDRRVEGAKLKVPPKMISVWFAIESCLWNSISSAKGFRMLRVMKALAWISDNADQGGLAGAGHAPGAIPGRRGPFHERVHVPDPNQGAVLLLHQHRTTGHSIGLCVAAGERTTPGKIIIKHFNWFFGWSQSIDRLMFG